MKRKNPLKQTNFFTPPPSKFILLIILLNELLLPQNPVDSTNSITMDNLTQQSGHVISGNDTIGYYQEFSTSGTPGWFTGISSGYGGDHRYAAISNRKPMVSLKINISVTDTYLVYYYHPRANTPNKAFVKFYNPEDSALVDSIHYNMLNNNVRSDLSNCWFLIGMVIVNAGKPGIEIQLSKDSSESGILASDAVRLLRSNASGSDLEFGNRRFSNTNHNFFKDRVPIEFFYTIFNWNGYQDKKLMLYNIGSSDLNISDIRFLTDKFSVIESFPIVINPGNKKEITVRFSPSAEGIIRDTMAIVSNDEQSPLEIIPLWGEGIAYNFVLNASVDGTEPHWNVPLNAVFYTSTSNWVSSTPSPWSFPISGGNLSSVVNTSSDPSIKATYEFSLPDSLTGQYTLEYSGPSGSSNAAQHAIVDLITPLYMNPIPALGDTQRVTDVNLRAVQSNNQWIRIGAETIFQINGGGQTTIIITNPYQGADLLRMDLIRVKKYYPPSFINTGNSQTNPDRYSLLQNFPNPFNPSTKIEYSLSERGHVNLLVYDILGRKVAELVNNIQEAGLHSVNFSARDLSSGVYFYRITSRKFSSTRKMLLLR